MSAIVSKPELRPLQSLHSRCNTPPNPPPLSPLPESQLLHTDNSDATRRNGFAILDAPCGPGLAKLASSLDQRDAFEIRRASCYDLSESSIQTSATVRISLTTAHGRQPPVDPRKTRRYCTDFGLGRSEPLELQTKPPSSSTPPSPDHFSLSSETEETGSETASILDYPFPKPPSFEDQFKLRRMHSSPMIITDDSSDPRHVRAKRYSAFAVGHDNLHYHPPTILATIPDEGSVVNEIQPHTSFRHTMETADTLDHNHTYMQQGPPPFNHIRHRLAPPTQGSASSGGRSFISPKPSLESLQRFRVSVEKLKKYDPQRSFMKDTVSGAHLRPQQNPRSPTAVSFGAPPSLAAAGRQKPTHRQHMSTAAAGFERPFANVTGPTSLGTPFQHRSTRIHPNLRPSAQQDLPIPKSFIEITPERPESRAQRLGTSQGKTERVKKILRRASTMFSWNKAFGRKK